MALIPPHFVDSVVAIGNEDAEGEKWWIASGFLYGKYVGAGEDGKPQHRVYLVTNRHVLAENELLYLRCNPAANAPARDYPLVLHDQGRPVWFGHPDPAVDVGVVPIKIQKLRADGMQVAYFAEERDVATTEKLRSSGVSEGDHVYVLGFPMGMVGGLRNSVIVRGGVLARVRDVFVDPQAPFLVDAFVFPGNSGGPVVSQPELLSIVGTKAPGKAYLIGICFGSINYRDVAVSARTGRQRVLFEDNAGLANVHSVDCVQMCIQVHLGSGPKNPPGARRKSLRPPPPPSRGSGEELLSAGSAPAPAPGTKSRKS